MSPTLSHFRRMKRWLGPILGLVLACAVVTLAAHRHSDGDSHTPCTLCTVSHMPAVPSAAVPIVITTAGFVRKVIVAAELPGAPLQFSPQLGRAPPSA